MKSLTSALLALALLGAGCTKADSPKPASASPAAPQPAAVKAPNPLAGEPGQQPPPPPPPDPAESLKQRLIETMREEKLTGFLEFERHADKLLLQETALAKRPQHSPQEKDEAELARVRITEERNKIAQEMGLAPDDLAGMMAVVFPWYQARLTQVQARADLAALSAEAVKPIATKASRSKKDRKAQEPAPPPEDPAQRERELNALIDQASRIQTEMTERLGAPFVELLNRHEADFLALYHARELSLAK